MKIRELDSRHVDAAVELWDRSGLTRPWKPPHADLLRALDGETSTVLGGCEGEHLIATVMAGHDGHRGWVYYLAVDEGHRRNGHGGRMMAAAESWLREHGAVKIQLMVRASNERVLSFYDRLGYEDADVRVRAKWLSTPERNG